MPLKTGTASKFFKAFILTSVFLLLSAVSLFIGLFEQFPLNSCLRVGYGAKKASFGRNHKKTSESPIIYWAFVSEYYILKFCNSEWNNESTSPILLRFLSQKLRSVLNGSNAIRA